MAVHSGEQTFISYRDWGELFFRTAVTAERVLGGVNVLAGRPIDVGPMGVGPGRIVQLRAHGEIGAASYDAVPGDLVSYRVTLPVSLDFEVDLQVEKHRFHADLVVPLVLTAQAADGLTVFIDVDPPTADEIGIDLRAAGLRASLLQRVAGVEGEVRRFVAKYVRRELDKPYVRDARTIDVASAIDKAWAAVGPKSGKPDQVVEDLEEAIETEIRENEQAFLDQEL